MGVIWRLLNLNDLNAASQVCKLWARLIKEDTLGWQERAQERWPWLGPQAPDFSYLNFFRNQHTVPPQKMESWLQGNPPNRMTPFGGDMTMLTPSRADVTHLVFWKEEPNDRAQIKLLELESSRELGPFTCKLATTKDYIFDYTMGEGLLAIATGMGNIAVWKLADTGGEEPYLQGSEPTLAVIGQCTPSLAIVYNHLLALTQQQDTGGSCLFSLAPNYQELRKDPNWCDTPVYKGIDRIHVDPNNTLFISTHNDIHVWQLDRGLDGGVVAQLIEIKEDRRLLGIGEGGLVLGQMDSSHLEIWHSRDTVFQPQTVVPLIRHWDHNTFNGLHYVFAYRGELASARYVEAEPGTLNVAITLGASEKTFHVELKVHQTWSHKLSLLSHYSCADFKQRKTHCLVVAISVKGELPSRKVTKIASIDLQKKAIVHITQEQSTGSVWPMFLQPQWRCPSQFVLVPMAPTIPIEIISFKPTPKEIASGKTPPVQPPVALPQTYHSQLALALIAISLGALMILVQQSDDGRGM